MKLYRITRAPINEANGQAGKRLYNTKCMSCHGPEMKGTGNFPNLLNVYKKHTTDSFVQLLSGTRRMLPAFNQLTAAEKQALALFVLAIKTISLFL